MTTLRIQHSVLSYEGWKQMFDSDPADRKGSGVRNFQIYRGVEDPNFVMIDLEFDTVAQAEGLLATMPPVWAGPAKDFMKNPAAWIVEREVSVEL
jgi:hypothetical protein